MKTKLKWIAVGLVVAAVFYFGILDFQKSVNWIRYVFFRARGTVANVGSTSPVGNKDHARVCRENLQRIQAAKRKAAQDRGQPLGAITWEEVVRAVPGVPAHRLTPRTITDYIPKCPGGGTYSIGTLEEVPRCTVSGQGTLDSSDDHIIRN